MRRLSTLVTESTGSTSIEDYEYYRDRVQDALFSLDMEIQDFLEDSEYAADRSESEVYVETAKRAISRSKREIENRLAWTEMKANPAREPSASTTHWCSLAHSVRMPPIKLEQFTGDVETWSRFWEQISITNLKLNVSIHNTISQ